MYTIDYEEFNCVFDFENELLNSEIFISKVRNVQNTQHFNSEIMILFFISRGVRPPGLTYMYTHFHSGALFFKNKC